DFINESASGAVPAAEDWHGTACAGVICSRDRQWPGVAPAVSLIAARIAAHVPKRNWFVLDGYWVAEGIDWAWRQGAHVLANSWGGGPEEDIIRLAFERALRRGRGGKGCVVVAAAGNTGRLVEFPASLPSVLAVGATNQWDQRKTKVSRD